MSYQSISVKEAVNNINGALNGWFLPPVQRPYVWGNRYENELYICKLFDSLLRGYPIGSIILWNTEEEIPHREFLRDYKIGEIPSYVDKGLWSKKDKWLVYDGQQRLQTLYSCLKYSLNGKILVFNLLFDLDKELEDLNETGFTFIEKNSKILSYFVRLNELFSKQPDEKVIFRRQIISQCDSLNDEQKNLLETNIDRLWDIFVKTDTKSIAYFPIQHKDESRVNEIFQRLNTGGVPLSQADLLFSRIKEEYFDFEENLQVSSKKIYSLTGNGFFFDSYSILQSIYLIVKGTTRIDPKKIKTKDELKKFKEVWDDLEKPLFDFFSDFIWGQFKINNAAIVPKKLAILPMIIYFYKLYKKGTNFKKLSSENLLKLKQYFILSQINDWNIQSIIDNFSRTINEISNTSKGAFDFPLDKFIDWLNQTKRRNTELLEVSFIDYQWFSLKTLMPDRVYQFDPAIMGRFNPEIDHIFPLKLESQNSEYYKSVDIIWNMQPVKGEINNFKRARNPVEFFRNEGRKYLTNDYDYLPSNDLNDDIWKNPLDFINKRKESMTGYFKNEYKLELK